ncbi:MAG: alpha/beta hydrolase [Chloroflexota bacterium]
MVGETIKVNVPRSSYVETNGITLHVMRAGHNEGEPVILLHGFPEFWYGWHNQIAPLAEAGYRVVIPDQRGYNLSDKPDGVENYSIEKLVADIIGLMDALEYDKVRLVGHDWGAIIAWYAAMWHPERIHQLSIMNVPHPYVFTKTVRADVSQMLKSWYIGMFQLPALPEQIIKFNDFSTFSDLMLREADLRDDELRRYKEAWSQPGAMTAMVNWYRAAARHSPEKTLDGRITVPTLMLWGKQDFALSADMAEPSIEMCDEGKLVFFKNAGHFVQHQRDEKVSQYLIDFFNGGSAESKTLE